ncbi:MAG: hypothetical protein JAY67_06950 [Candidatus Thiodiazotropha taylori]|nr:hypothetical protein [Candidatus Thiodiazotropha taylori]
MTATFLRLTPGAETTVSSQIECQPNKSHIFKFIGSYDLLHLEITDKHSSLYSNPRIDDILETSSISTTPLPVCPDSTTSQFVENFETACGYPILALVFIQLRTDEGYASKQKIQQDLIIQSREELSQQKHDFCLEGLISYGKDDLCILFGTTTFSSIFELLKNIRNKYGEVLIDSTTYTTIAYDFVEHRDKLLQLDEEVAVEILVSCEPGGEQKITSSFDRKDFNFTNVLGKEDIRITSKNKITLGSAIGAVLDCRGTEGKANNALLTTTTHIECDIDISSDAPDYDKKFALTPKRKKFRDITNNCLVLLENVAKYKNIDQYFVQKCKEAVTKLRASALIESSYHLTSDLDVCIEYELSQILKELTHEIESGEGILTTERAFQFLTSNIVNAAAQRTLNLHDYRQGLPDLPNQFGQGAFTISEAISKLVRQIYEIMETERVGTGEWEGFILFSQFHGFKCFTSSVFSLPSNSLSSILDPSLNWLTLSHEICHDIWADQDVYITPRAWVVGGVNASFKDILSGIASDAGIAPPDSKFSMVAEPMLGEWYAHWFDYRHFYASDFKFFAWSIWSSWLRLPLVQNNITEYFHRTLAVYVAKNLDRYTENHLSREDTINLTLSLFDELLDLLVQIEPIGLEKKHESMIRDERDEISTWIGSNIGFIHQFEESCCKPQFAARMTHDVNDALTLVPQLAEGVPINAHNNVLALLIASMKWIYSERHTIINHKFSLAFIMSCLFAVTNYENRNPS